MKTTIPAFLHDVSNENTSILNRLNHSYGYMIRYAFKRLVDESMTKGDLEKKLSKDTGLSIRHAKDAVEDTRQIIKSQHKLVKDYVTLWSKRVEITKKRLHFFTSTKPNAKRKIYGLTKKLEKQERKLVFWKEHQTNHTFPPVIFGGKKNFYQRCKGLISKEQWDECRNGRLSSRGDTTKGGNPNLRIVFEEDQFYLLINTDVDLNKGGKRPVYQKIKLPLYIATKFSKRKGKINGRNYRDLMKKVLQDGEAYQVEILKRNGKFYVHIAVNEEEKSFVTHPVNGYRGIDTNPNGLAIAQVLANGNPIKFEWIGDGRLQDTRNNKRMNIIGELVSKEIEICKKEGTGLILEDLSFIHDKDVSSKFNRMSHSFCYRNLLNQLERKAILEGIEVIKVKPQYTSIIGRLKYQGQFGISIHQSAALVIARRGMNFKKEKVPKKLVNLCVKKEKQKVFYESNEWKQWSTIKKTVEKKLKTKGGNLVSWLDKRKELFT